MTTSIAVKVRERIGQLRMELLGYEYDYDRETNEAIVLDVLGTVGPQIEDDNPKQRRFARTIAQYRAQLVTRPQFSVWLFEVSSLIGLPVFLFAAWSINCFSRASSNSASPSGVRLVFAKRWRTNPEIFSIPQELGTTDIETRTLTDYRITSQDLGLVINLFWRSILAGTPFPAQLALKCAVDLAHVRAALTGQKPRFILLYWEFSCSLSFITQAMCESGIETYNVMHGDKFYYAKHAFFEVTRCYCWSKFYIDLFTEEYVKADFRVFQNKSFILTAEEKRDRKQLGKGSIGIAAPHIATLTQDRGQDASATRAFSVAVNELAKTRATKIRPHPFYEAEFDSFRPHLAPMVCIEPPNSTTPRRFLIENDIIIGTVSTLLLEAAHLGFDVIILKTDAMKSVESYHYLYRMENVRTASLESLPETVASIDAGRELRQTNA